MAIEVKIKSKGDRVGDITSDDLWRQINGGGFAITTTGVCSNMTFQDISMGSARKVNAKNGSTNNGNNLGIIFVDQLAYIG